MNFSWNKEKKEKFKQEIIIEVETVIAAEAVIGVGVDNIKLF